MKIKVKATTKSPNASEYIVFDAFQDNNGRGIKAKDIIKILKKINNWIIKNIF